MNSPVTNNIDKLPEDIRVFLINEIERAWNETDNWGIAIDFIAQKYLELQEENERLKKVEIIEPLIEDEFKKVYLKKCNGKTDTVCINHFPVEEFHSHR